MVHGQNPIVLGEAAPTPVGITCNKKPNMELEPVDQMSYLNEVQGLEMVFLWIL